MNILLAGTFLEYKPALEITRCSARDECIRSQVYGGRLYAILRAGSALANFQMGQKAPVLERFLHYVADRHILKLIASSTISYLIYEGTQG